MPSITRPYALQAQHIDRPVRSLSSLMSEARNPSSREALRSERVEDRRGFGRGLRSHSANMHLSPCMCSLAEHSGAESVCKRLIWCEWVWPSPSVHMHRAHWRSRRHACAQPGSATLPMMGVRPVVVDPSSGVVVEGNGVEGAKHTHTRATFIPLHNPNSTGAHQYDDLDSFATRSWSLICTLTLVITCTLTITSTLTTTLTIP